jgi:sugar lactone lactonase YvrE
VRKVFISYARVNRAQVEKLVEHLGYLGCQTWIDSSLQGGQQWWEQILRKIAESDVFFPVISRDALNSAACQREFDWAEALRKPMLPVAVEPLSKALSPRLARLQVIDYFDPAQQERNALTLAGALAALPPAPSLPEPMPEPPAVPLSYLSNLADLVSGPNPLDHEQQRQILVQLESALRSVDLSERQGGLDILERFSSRENLFADVDRRLTSLRASTPSASPSQSATQPPVVRSTPSVSPQPPTPDRVSTSAPKPRKVRLAAVAALAVVALGVVAAYLVWPRPTPSQTAAAQPASPGGQTAQPASPGGQTAHPGSPGGQTSQPGSPGGQTVLPFTGLLGARGVAVDTAGNVYAAAQTGLYELAAGASASVQLPLTGGQPQAVAVDSAGTVYVADVTRNAVWKLAAGSGTPAVVPLTGKCGERDIPVGSPVGVAVDSGGSIYVADGSCQGRVLMLAAGSSTATVLPFTGLNQISGVAADSAGNVYVTDGALSANGRVLKLASGSNRPTTLPFAGLKMPQGVAVDSAGNLYVTDDGNKQVLKLAAGSSTPTVLPPPFASLNGPYGVAVDHAGNVYVTDGQRVLKLAAG